ncbi:hypothetical protein [Actinacidiphila sp. ITFR-21]|uniref:hypothetical protein n=1 Tax=Actinacidiphila sp. ITFR-21 TaxID=3075199 RepID=UPI00288B64D0|nr:hypothetical protein [Streptomyces sp. ITFR-21]WNI16805.1 hypothetical protein RLT57_15630 [Streptomyces sp. ITFR-21]
MGKFTGMVLTLAATAGALALVHAAGAPLPVVLTAAVGVLSLGWLLLLLTVPWNLYFRAHTVLAEIATSRTKGLDIPATRDAEAARIARLMLRTAVAGHVVTAGAVAVTAVLTGRGADYWFAGFFLFSTVFRPAGAYFAQLRRRLTTLLKDVTFPRDDVLELRTRLDSVQSGTRVLEDKAEEHYQALAEIRRNLDALGTSVYARAADADRKITALGRQFEATVNRLTDNQEIITGLKAFLRLLRASDALDDPAAS